MKDLTIEDVSRAIGDTVTPVAEKASGVLGKMKTSPSKINSFVKRAVTKVLNFIWRLITSPFMPIVNHWRNS